MSEAPFRLSSMLKAHESDVKAVDFLTGPKGISSLMASGSRDGQLKLWSIGKDNQAEFIASHQEHSNFVNAVSFIERSEDHPSGMIASGGADNLIRLMDIQAQRIDGVLIGHQKNVCTLASYQQRILSGSWDGTARVWEGGHLLWTLKGHENAVWCVLFLDDETFLTGTLQPQSPAREISVCCVGSADKTIKLWKQDQCLKTFTGHSDCIRSLQLLDLNRGTFASTSNDGTIRLWSIEDDQIGTIDSAHDSFIYTLAKIDANHVASAGEDRCIKIWDLKAKQCLQSIPIPAVSIWCLCCLDEYTLACGTNDGNVYMFSSDPLRQLQDEALLQLFQERLGSNTISKASMSSSIDASKVQGVESLSRPGKKPGENRMVNNNGKVEVYQWDSAEWIKIGDVVDSAGSSVKQEYAGQEYDYVFDVQVEDGGPSLKLPYNLSENPYVVAQKYVADNDLPVQYVEQVVDFILKNTQTKTIESSQELFNPYHETKGPMLEESKPLLTKDPFRLGSANLEGIRKKIAEFNENLNINHRIGLDSLDGVIQRLNNSKKTPIDTTELLGKLAGWPIDKLFPVLDFVRMMVLDDALAKDTLGLIKKVVLHGTLTSSDPKLTQANTLMQLRLLTNAFQSKILAESLLSCIMDVIKTLRAASAVPTKEPTLFYLALFNLSWSAVANSKGPDTLKYIVPFIMERIRGAEGEAEQLLLLSSIAVLEDHLTTAQKHSLQTELGLMLSRNLSTKASKATQEIIAKLS